MPHLKARQYALLHLKQMKEVTIHLYNLTVKYDWKFVWLNFQPFSHDNVYRALSSLKNQMHMNASSFLKLSNDLIFQSLLT